MILRNSCLLSCFLVVAGCSSVGYKKFDSRPFSEIKDVSPRIVSFGKAPLAPSKNVKQRAYYTRFLQGVGYLNAGNPDAAINNFSICIKLVNDEGNSFFMRARCYLLRKDLKSALRDFVYAQEGGYEKEKTGEMIGVILSRMAHEYVGQKAWKEALAYYKTAVQYARSLNDCNNALVCYQKLAASRQGRAKVITYFHAFNFSRKYGLKPSKYLYSLAAGFSDALFDSQDTKLIKAAIPRILYAMNGYQDREHVPFLHRNLGVLYLLLGDIPRAREEFKLIISKYAGSKVYKNCFNQYHSLTPSRYTYHVRQEFSITGAVTNIRKAPVRMTLAVPQTVDEQKTGGLKILVNGSGIPFTTRKDRFGTTFAVVDITGKVRAGTNILEIKAIVEKTGKRVPLEKIKAMTVGQYRKEDARYKLLTASHSIVQVSNPLVQGILGELKGKIKTDNIHEIANAVYNYVIDKMNYKLYDNEHRPKNTIIDRLQRANYSGVCEDYAALTAALLRGFGIPASCYTGPMLNEKIGHAWTVFYLPDNTSVTLDTTWGDGRLFRQYYRYYASNLTVADQIVYNSDVLDSAGSLQVSAGSTIRLKMLKRSTFLKLAR